MTNTQAVGVGFQVASTRRTDDVWTAQEFRTVLRFLRTWTAQDDNGIEAATLVDVWDDSIDWSDPRECEMWPEGFESAEDIMWDAGLLTHTDDNDSVVSA